MRRLLILLGLAAAVWWWWASSRPLTYAAGVLIPNEPVQRAIEPKALGEIDGCQIQARASYTLPARILRTKRYWVRGEKLVPYDVAVGWGTMSDQAVLDHLRISQSNRFFFYEWQDQPPADPNVMARQASNVHVIAGNRAVARAVSGFRAGQLVTMQGYLVNVSGPNGFHWNSSMSRDDTGNGACEVFYVESVKPFDPTATPSATPAPVAVR